MGIAGIVGTGAKAEGPLPPPADVVVVVVAADTRAGVLEMPVSSQLPNGSKLTYLEGEKNGINSGIEWKWMANGWKWMEMDGNGWKWI